MKRKVEWWRVVLASFGFALLGACISDGNIWVTIGFSYLGVILSIAAQLETQRCRYDN